VQQALRADPFAGDVFIFRPRRADRVKILVYDGTGLCLYSEEVGGRDGSAGLAGRRRGAADERPARDPARGLAVAPAPAAGDPSPEHAW
jgi:transposase